MLPKKILVIYTGGTIGMMQPPGESYLRPVDFKNIRKFLPEIDRLSCEIDYYTFEEPIDSSNMSIDVWQRLARIFAEHYHAFDGFVILHGTDTMEYTSSALSFMLEGLRKPVILTGAQLPVAVIRTDARENLTTSLEIASHQQYTLPEVAVFFDSSLYRGNRTVKYSTERFKAFKSPHYRPLAEAGVDLEFYARYWRQDNETSAFNVQEDLCEHVGLFKFYPGVPRNLVETVIKLPDLKGLVLETYGAGNLPDYPWFIDCLKERIDDGLIVANVSQCTAGRVTQERYKNSNALLKIGVLSGKDMTPAAAVTKLMYLLAKTDNRELIARDFISNLRGELTEHIHAPNI